jgi:hypothetical protein
MELNLHNVRSVTIEPDISGETRWTVLHIAFGRADPQVFTIALFHIEDLQAIPFMQKAYKEPK